MSTRESNLVTHLLLENCELRQLFLAEQQKVAAERRRRIVAEARLAAHLKKQITEVCRNSSCNSCSKLDSTYIKKSDKENFRRNDIELGFTDSSDDDLLLIGNEKIYEQHATSASAKGLFSVNRLITSKHPGSLNDRRKSNHSISSSEMVPSCYFQPEEMLTSSSFWISVDKDGAKNFPKPPPLSRMQQKRKEAFIMRSNERQNCIKEASARRKELASQKRKVAKQLLAGQVLNRDVLRVLGRMDREICAFPSEAMKRETFRRLRQCRDFQEKKKRGRDEYNAHINRLLAYCYSQVPYGYRRKW